MGQPNEDPTRSAAEQARGEPPGGRATRGPAIHSGGEQQPDAPIDEEHHGWAPDAPGTGPAAERVVEGHQKAFHPEGTQAASRAEGDVEVVTDEAPAPVSVGTRGEDIAKEQGKESGRYDAGTKGESERPVGKSEMEDSTGVATGKSKPLDEDMPTMPSGDQGG